MKADLSVGKALVPTTRLSLALCVLALVPLAQSQQAPQSTEPSLTDAARQAKADREANRARQTDASRVVNRMAEELSEREEAAAVAPVGFRYITSDDRSYRILVPELAQIQRRDSRGTTLQSSGEIGFSTVIVLGAPVLSRGQETTAILVNAIRDYGCTLGYSSRQTVNGHPAAWVDSTCGGERSWGGSTQFVIGEEYVYPVACGFLPSGEDLAPTPTGRKSAQRAYEATVRMRNREGAGLAACRTVFSSLQFLQEAQPWEPKAGQSLQQSPRKAPLEPAPIAPAPGQGPDLAEVARAGRQGREAAGKRGVIEDLTHASDADYDQHPITYCTKRDCYEASALIPRKARRLDAGPHRFELPLENGTGSIEIIAGAPSESEVMPQREYVKARWPLDVAPVGYTHPPGSLETVLKEERTVQGYPARFVRFRTAIPAGFLVGEQLTVMAPGRFLAIRCSSSEKNFAQLEPVCRTIANSLRLSEIGRYPGAFEDPDDP